MTSEGRRTSWCDGTPHSPQAIPPLPFHDWRYDGDDPYVVCRRCGTPTPGLHYPGCRGSDV